MIELIYQLNLILMINTHMKYNKNFTKNIIIFIYNKINYKNYVKNVIPKNIE